MATGGIMARIYRSASGAIPPDIGHSDGYRSITSIDLVISGRYPGMQHARLQLVVKMLLKIRQFVIVGT
jgi:hypothetical protein